MRNLSHTEVAEFFANFGCVLLSEYKKCDIPVDYICRCGRKGQITIDKFRRRVKSNDGKCRYCSVKNWTTQEDNVLIQHYGISPRQLILDLLPGVSYVEIKNRAYKLNLTGNRSLVLRKARVGKGRKYKYDEDFFDDVNLISSYWAGFIAAEGNINDVRHRIAIKLGDKDRKHLENFVTTVGYTGTIYQIAAKGRSKPQVLLHINGASRWVSSLRDNYCVTARKSLTLQPPIDLEEQNSIAFIIGYIDGRGCISVDGDSLQLVGTNDLLCWIKMWFDRWCPSMQRRMAVVRPSGMHFRYSISGKRSAYLLNKMNLVDVPKLKRKWERINRSHS